MTHKRTGKRARAERQERARDREVQTSRWMERYMHLTPEQRLLEAIFGAWKECSDCNNEVLRGTDCQSPHCKVRRGESSVFYEEITDDSIRFENGTLDAGVDY